MKRARIIRGAVGALIVLDAFTPSAPAADLAFVHPGLLHSRQDIARMKAAIAAKQEPISSGYEVFRQHPASQADYRMQGPGEEIGRSPTVNFREYDSDANAAYQCALMWALTGERPYADKAKAIVNGWSATLRRVTGADAVLMAGLGPFKMINAAELLRHTAAGWSEAEARQSERSFREVIYPILQDFAPFANGNWDTAAIKTVIAIGVFGDDRDIFERGLRYYVNGSGDGALTHYIINEAGQCQESGRDQQHTQLGLAHLGDACEIAWHQGLDLYGYADNRLLRGFEYTARYNLGADVPFVETLDRTGKYHHTAISPQGRGQLRPVFEQIYNHYVNRRGESAPWTEKAAAKLRPEHAGRPGADHPGFGTLFYSRPPLRPSSNEAERRLPAAPAAVVAHGDAQRISLSWVAPIGAQTYTVKRRDIETSASSGRAGSRVAAGRFETIARNVGATEFTDTRVRPGDRHAYVVFGSNADGDGAVSPPAVVGAGLPAPWSQATIGDGSVQGNAQFDGEIFTLEAAGNDFGGASDQGYFASGPLAGNGTIVARFVPQVSAQSSIFGVSFRASNDPAAAHVSLLLAPRPREDRERPGWGMSLASRAAAGRTATIVASSAAFSAPLVSWGRLLQPCWLRLTRTGNTISAAWSADGKTWLMVGTTDIPLGREVRAGLVASSQLPTLTTTIRFDHVAISSLPAP